MATRDIPGYRSRAVQRPKCDSAFDAARNLVETRAMLDAGSSNRIRDVAAIGNPKKD